MPALVDVYLAWKHGAALQSHDLPLDGQNPTPDTPPGDAGRDWFTVAAIKDTGAPSAPSSALC